MLLVKKSRIFRAALPLRTDARDFHGNPLNPARKFMSACESDLGYYIQDDLTYTHDTSVRHSFDKQRYRKDNTAK